MNVPITTIKDLGFDEFFETSRKQLGPEDFELARVITQHKGVYKVKTIEGEYLAKVTGKQIFEASSKEDFPTVGDWVAINKLDDEKAVIQFILPRKTVVKKKSSKKDEIQMIAANIDVAFVIESVDRDFNLNRFERYFSITSDGHIQPAIILNKIDLISQEELDLKLDQIKERFSNIDVISTSTLSKKGLDELRNYVQKGKTYCFFGSSGVGKSSLINSLLGQEEIKTKEIASWSGRGKHTTTAREMYFLENGAIVIDNPGMREVGMADTNAGIENFFDEISVLARNCKYVDCTHIHEPDCAVLAAVKDGKLDPEKYSNYINLKKEADYYESSDAERRREDRNFGKFLKNAKKDLKKFRQKDY